MGCIRFLLAISVMIAHAGPLMGIHFFDPVMAVQTFYMISGFYMTLIINEKYTGPNAYKLFISNRLLRILPVYYFVAAASLLGAFFFTVVWRDQNIICHFNKLPLLTKLYLLIINCTLIGQDSTVFLGFNADGTLHFVKDFLHTSPHVQSLLLCPPAWSLSLELMFYIIAPFVVKRKIWQILLMMSGSLIIRIVLYANGYSHDPWTYRFFPTELLFFTAGILSYRMYKVVEKYNFRACAIFKLLITACTIFLILRINEFGGKFTNKQFSFYIFFLFAIPFIYDYTKNIRLDRILGELSYPIYLSHMFVLLYCVPLYNYFFKTTEHNVTVTFTVTIGLSILIVRYVVQPIDIIRSNRMKKFSAHN